MKKSIKNIVLASMALGFIALNGCDGTVPALPTSQGCFIMDRSWEIGGDNYNEKFDRANGTGLDNVFASSPNRRFEFVTPQQMKVYDNQNNLIETRELTYNASNSPSMISILNSSGVETKRKVYTYGPNANGVIQLEKIEISTVSSGTLSILEKLDFTYDGNLNRFIRVDFTSYDGVGPANSFIKFNDWDGKKNPTKGQAGELLLNTSYFREFDYWMYQNPTSILVDGQTITLSYEEYNSQDYPEKYFIQNGANTIEYNIDYRCQ